MYASEELVKRVDKKDRTPSKYVATGKVTMAEKGSRHVSRKGADDKRQVTATLSETLSGLNSFGPLNESSFDNVL